MKNKVKTLVIIIVLLVVALGTIRVLYLNEIKYKMSTVNNYLDNLNEKVLGNFGMGLNLNYASEIRMINEEENITDVDFSSYHVEYHYTGENIGKLFINDKEVDINNGIIQDMRIGSDYDGLYNETFKIGETYKFTSTLYILFNDGTIGKISTKDIINNNYNITMLSEYRNIEYFVELEPIDSGADINLWAVDNSGEVFAIDMVSAGA